ncbi:MAG: C40 family peptidase [Thermomicrobiales bacterium]|mgnify:CR=1 FL=1
MSDTRSHFSTGLFARRRVLALAATAPIALMLPALVASAKGNGKDVVKIAMKHKGDKYKWGGASPKGFDCSGFTWYCYKQATGMDIGRTVKSQWKQGKSVGKNDWQAGDIVFFKNTFEKGLSHTGIFISGEKFIHAENERTGVVISTLDSDYYNKHYAGARRLV